VNMPIERLIVAFGTGRPLLASQIQTLIQPFGREPIAVLVDDRLLLLGRLVAHLEIT
jgi:hypothetical protein